MILVITVGAATWYLSYAIIELNGPWQILARIRAWAFKASGDNYGGSFAELINCIYCLSPWVAGVISLAVTQSVAEFVLTALGGATVAIFINIIHERLT